jgi:Rrf2 family protein
VAGKSGTGPSGGAGSLQLNLNRCETPMRDEFGPLLTNALFATILVTDRGKDKSVIAANSQFAIAIHVLTLMALHHKEPDPVTSELMASSVNTHPVFIRRVLGQLSRAGLVASQPGVGGGWRLRRDPDHISLLDVYRAVAVEHLLGLHHNTPNPKCLIGRNIQRTLTSSFAQAEQAFEQTLAHQTIAQMLATAQEDPQRLAE